MTISVAVKYERLIAEGLKAKKMYAPVKKLSAREYHKLLNREKRNGNS